MSPSTVEDFKLLADAKLLVGRFPGVDIDSYHRQLPGISKTDIENAALSPANMIARRSSEDKKSDALIMGQMLHSRLEFYNDNEKFNSLFVQMPTFKGEGSRAAKAEWILQNKDKTALDASDLEAIEGMLQGVLRNPQSCDLLKAEGINEETIYWNDLDSGVLCKCRPDKRVFNYLGSPITIDWKTIGRFSVSEVQSAIKDYSYHVSAAFTIDGLRATGAEPGPYVFVFIEKTDPHRVLCVPARDVDVEIGRHKYKKILKQIAECQKTGVYPGFVDLGLPEWNVQRELEQIAIGG